MSSLIVAARFPCLEHHDLLFRGADFPDLVDLAPDDDHPRHAAPHLLGDAAVLVRVIPEDPPGVIAGHADLISSPVSGGDLDEYVIRPVAGRHVEAVRVQIRRRPFVGPVHILRVRWLRQLRQVVREVDLQRVAGPDFPGVPRHDPVVRVGLDRLRRPHVDDALPRRQRHLEHPGAAPEDPGLRQLGRPAGVRRRVRLGIRRGSGIPGCGGPEPVLKNLAPSGLTRH